MSTISGGVEGPGERTALDVLDLDLGSAILQRKGDMRWNLGRRQRNHPSDSRVGLRRLQTSSKNRLSCVRDRLTTPGTTSFAGARFVRLRGTYGAVG